MMNRLDYNPFLENLDFGQGTGMGRPAPSFDMGGGPGPGDMPAMENPMPMAPRPLFMGGRFVDPSTFSRPGNTGIVPPGRSGNTGIVPPGTGGFNMQGPPMEGPKPTPFVDRPPNLGEATDNDGDEGRMPTPMPVAPGKGAFGHPANGGFLGGPMARQGQGFGGFPPQFQALMQHPLFQRMLQSFQQQRPQPMRQMPQNPTPLRRDAGPGLGAGQPGIDWVSR